jgi:hypothetical protein
MLSRWVGALLLGPFWTGVASADAGCLYVPTEYHRVDVELGSTDTSAPEAPVLVEVAAFRRNGMTCTLASCVANSCGNTGTVRIALAPAADERTPVDELGYRLVLVSGVLPASMKELVGVGLAGDRPVFLRPAFEEVPALDVMLAAVAIDAAGNESAPSEPFAVRFDGCTLAAVGDQCEDEVDPGTDLSASLHAAPIEEVIEPGPVAGGVSCSLPARPAPAPAWWGLIGCGLLWRRRQRCTHAVDKLGSRGASLSAERPTVLGGPHR